MSTVQTEGNNLRGKSSDVLESEMKIEREKWMYKHEPWSPEYERRVSMQVVSSGSMIEATGGFAVIILCILGLFNVMPVYLFPVAALVLGVALLFEGGAVASRYWKLPVEINADRWSAMQLTEGMIAEFSAGIAGIVLGILAIVGFAPLLLVISSVLVFGSALILGSGLTFRLNSLEYGITDERIKSERFWFANWTVASVQFVLGCTAIVLGILALLGVFSVTLTIVALLLLGFSALISGTAVCNRIMHLLHRC